MVAKRKHTPHLINRQFEFTDENFQFLKKMILSSAGIMLSDIKREMVYGRLTRRLRALNIESFDEYCTLLENDNRGEVDEFTNAITTNLTAFFREDHHFEFLQNNLLKNILNKKKDRRIRIWSAGCSTGEEPYSIAMVLKETIPTACGWDIKVLATDLDSNVVATAKSGSYELSRIKDISDARKKRWFIRGVGDKQNQVQVKQDLQNLLTFRQLNLMNEWPMNGKFDVIFCRNVIIYFSKDTQKILFDRFADYLTEDGHMIVGHSESLYGVTDRLKLLGKTIYQKIR